MNTLKIFLVTFRFVNDPWTGVETLLPVKMALKQILVINFLRKLYTLNNTFNYHLDFDYHNKENVRKIVSKIVKSDHF